MHAPPSPSGSTSTLTDHKCNHAGSFLNLLCQSAAWCVTWQTRHRSAHRGPGRDHMVLACYLVAMTRLVQSCTITAHLGTTTSTRQMLLGRDHRYPDCLSCSCVLDVQIPSAASIETVETCMSVLVSCWNTRCDLHALLHQHCMIK